MVENNIAVFLDRDGVVNECIYINNKCFAPKNISDFKFINRSIDAIIKSAATENVGDGKIFILPVDEAFRIRTGEKGKGSLN